LAASVESVLVGDRVSSWAGRTVSDWLVVPDACTLTVYLVVVAGANPCAPDRTSSPLLHG